MSTITLDEYLSKNKITNTAFAKKMGSGWYPEKVRRLRSKQSLTKEEAHLVYQASNQTVDPNGFFGIKAAE